MKNINLKIKAALMLILTAFSFLTGGMKFGTEYCEKCSTGAVSFEDIRIMEESRCVSSRIFELLFGKREEEVLLCPSGEAFGILIKEEGVTVCSAASGCGLLPGDRIIKIGSKSCSECEEIYDAVRESGGAPLSLTVVRAGEEKNLSVVPKYKDGEYRLGITLRSQTAGIGTVTFIDPATMAFGGLGHSVSDAESGTPVSLKGGIATNVLLSGCKKGEPGRAGELSGILKRNSIGSICKNTECGVFGKLDSMLPLTREAIPIGRRAEVKCGQAEIISTVKNGLTATYKIEITEIDEDSQGSKSFKIKVTDPTLIAITGGIVRGMSGSPIIQDGKLVGAVTHVLVANPTEGYGIFIENMLNAANQQTQPKAA